jgi:hypothetical protein
MCFETQHFIGNPGLRRKQACWKSSIMPGKGKIKGKGKGKKNANKKSESKASTAAPAAKAVGNAYTALDLQPMRLFENDYKAPAVNEKKKEEPLSLMDKANGNPAGFRFFITDQKDGVGRRAIARKQLKAGSVLVREKGLVILYQEHMDRVCGHCCEELSGLNNPACGDCGITFCFAKCQRQCTVHAYECKALTDLRGNGQDLELPEVAVRVMIRFLAMQERDAQLDAAAEAEAEVEAEEVIKKPVRYDALSFTSSVSDITGMGSHLDALNEEEHAMIFAAMQQIIKHFPSCASAVQGGEGGQALLEMLVKLVSIINTNSHGLSYEKARNEVFGLGLFPLGAIFNHSCFPNCIYTSEGSSMTFRTIRSVKAGEELCVNYVDLYKTRRTRRVELQVSKQFNCECIRCSLRPSREEELHCFKNEGNLCGVKCIAHKQNESKSVSRSCEGFYALDLVRGAEEAKADHSATCSVCGDVQDGPALAGIVSKHKTSIDAALEEYYQMRTGQLSKSADHVQGVLEHALSTATTALHPHHECLLQLYLALTNACGVAKDHNAKIKYARMLVTMADASLPRNFLPVVDYTKALANALASNTTHRVLPPKLRAKQEEEVRSLLQRIVDIHKVCSGEKSRAYTAALNELNNNQSE